MTNIQELIPFSKACDELVSGKYILVDIKINSILKIIEEDSKIGDIINSCLNHTDFKTIVNKYIYEDTDGKHISTPTDEKELITLVFNLLYRFKNGELNFLQFLNEYYNTQDGSDFTQFGNDLIIPFKNAICNIYSKRHVLVNSDDYQDNYYNKIKTTIKLIFSNIDNYKLKDNDKEEFSMLLNALYLASEKNDKKLVYSLMIGIDYFTKYHKKTRTTYLSLEECFG